MSLEYIMLIGGIFLTYSVSISIIIDWPMVHPITGGRTSLFFHVQKIIVVTIASICAKIRVTNNHQQFFHFQKIIVVRKASICAKIRVTSKCFQKIIVQKLGLHANAGGKTL